MEKASRIAYYIIERYREQFGVMVDEVRLQKLLYFIQLEAIIRTGEPMFDAEFRARRCGPAIEDVHQRYKTMDFHEPLSAESQERWKECFDYVFEHYAVKTPSSLVGHSQCQKSWERARKGYGRYDNSDVPMKLSDIYEDAEDRKQRRASLPLRRAVHAFFETHPEIHRIPVIHSV